MKKLLFIFVLISLCLGCKKENIVELNFLDEYVIKDSIHFKNTIVGGISGVDYVKGSYYFVIDDAKNPRFLKSKIDIKKDTIHTLSFENVIFLNDTTETFYKENTLDLESIFIDENNNEVHFVSEGSIKKNKIPSVFKTDIQGNFIEELELPNGFYNLSNIKHNAAFEASSISVDKKGFWTAMENPLKSDGESPTFQKTISPIRITYFNLLTKKATKEFAYQLEHITQPPKGEINTNGVTAILEYAKNNFLVIERTYQSGYGSYGNRIKIYNATITKKTSNIIDVPSLKQTNFTPLEKKLLFDFSTVKNKLTKGIIDNIEGMTLGPKLSNGNPSLVLVSDDNFQLYGKQLNQFILMEIKKQ